MKALGEIDDFSIIEEMVGTTNDHKPNQDNVKIYQKLISIFINLSRSLEDRYAEIATFQREHITKDKEQK